MADHVTAEVSNLQFATQSVPVQIGRVTRQSAAWPAIARRVADKERRSLVRASLQIVADCANRLVAEEQRMRASPLLDDSRAPVPDRIPVEREDGADPRS